VLDPEDPRVRWATFGRQVEDFLDGPIGSHLLAKARAQSQEAVEKLKVADPEDVKTIRALQNQALVADSIMGWLGDVIHEGQGALEALKEDQDG
jgi:hypothetical protein